MVVTSCRKSVRVSVCLDKLLRRDFTATGSWKEEWKESSKQEGKTMFLVGDRNTLLQLIQRIKPTIQPDCGPPVQHSEAL